jgi:hypothetical protein
VEADCADRSLGRHIDCGDLARIEVSAAGKWTRFALNAKCF